MYIWTDKGLVPQPGPFYQPPPVFQTVSFRNHGYFSDILQEVPTSSPEESDLATTSVPLGVIQGTPPFPVNNGIPTEEAANTSTVEFTTSNDVTFSTAYTATAGITVSYGTKFGPVNTQTKLSAGVKYAHESSEERTVTKTDTLKNYNYSGYPGGIGWVLYLKPDIQINQYVLKSWARNSLAYDGNYDEFRISAITYGPNTSLKKKAFYLDNPSGPMGGTDFSTAIFEGMVPGPLSTDIAAWQEPVNDTDSYRVSNTLQGLSSTQGDLFQLSYVQTTTDAVTEGFNTGFSMEASAFGVGAGGYANFSMDVTTKTSMQYGLAFAYAVPSCGAPGSGTCCISDMTVIPYILVPNDDDSGYNASWISDDIRLYRRQKPWTLTYSAIPSNDCNNLGAAGGPPGSRCRRLKALFFSTRAAGRIATEYRQRSLWQELLAILT